MTDVEITVRGSHAVTVSPEQATVHVVVSGDGPSSEPVVRQVSQVVAAVHTSLESRQHPVRGPVTRYSIDQIRKGAQRPYNRDGVQLPMVYTAAVSLTATFTNFDELASWAGWAAAMDGLAISYIDWALTDANRAAIERRTRQEAVRDAVRRAQDYADALDLGEVQVRMINDPGIAGSPQPKAMMARSMANPGGGVPQISLQSEEIEVSSQVEATFVIAGRA